MKNDKNRLADNLKAMRVARGLTQHELSEKTGISQQNLSRWELGIHVPNIDDCNTLAVFYGVSLDERADREP